MQFNFFGYYSVSKTSHCQNITLDNGTLVGENCSRWYLTKQVTFNRGYKFQTTFSWTSRVTWVYLFPWSMLAIVKNVMQVEDLSMGCIPFPSMWEFWRGSYYGRAFVWVKNDFAYLRAFYWINYWCSRVSISAFD